MPDAPDWSQYQLQGSKDTLKDLAELAARIDARDVWERRGQVIWHDRFMGGMSPWVVSGSGTGNSVKLNADTTEWGGYSAMMTAGSDTGEISELSKFFPVPEINRWGAECSVWLRQEYVFFSVAIYATRSGSATVAEFALDRSLNEISARVLGGAYQKIATLSNPINAYGLYHQLKVVGDFETGMYVRAMYDQVEYDLSGLAMYVVVNPDVDNQELDLFFEGRPTVNDQASIGHVILTVGEP